MPARKKPVRKGKVFPQKISPTQLVRELSRQPWYLVPDFGIHTDVTDSGQCAQTAQSLICGATYVKRVLTLPTIGLGDLAEPETLIPDIVCRIWENIIVVREQNHERTIVTRQHLLKRLWASHEPEHRLAGIALWCSDKHIRGVRQCPALSATRFIVDMDDGCILSFGVDTDATLIVKAFNSEGRKLGNRFELTYPR